MRLPVVAAVIAFSVAPLAQTPASPSPQELYQKHRWFELRDAVAGRLGPSIHAGAVASAFNRTQDAERLLAQAVREATTVETANAARELLAGLYMRLGRSSDLIRVLDDALAAAPSATDIRNARQAFEPLRRAPNQTAQAGLRRAFQCEVSAHGVVLPATVNGKAVNWLLDTAFSQPAMSESEARSLGIAVSGATAAATDFAGGTTALRMSVAQRMTIGGVELRNVPVIVFPDSQPPFNEHPPGRRGAIGLPVALALEQIRWTNDGRCDVGPAPSRAPAGDGNLAFDGETPIVRTRFSGRPVDFVLDTGNQGGTQLWKRFSDDFPEVVKAGRPATKQVHQIGGATDQNIVEIPELHFQIAAFDGVLRPANVFAAPIGNDFQHGNLGMDVLGQAREVILDFRAMSLTIR